MATVAATGALPAAAQALPPCQNALPATGSASYDFGRINTSGYAGGSLLGINAGLVDQVTPTNTPKAFKPAAPPPVTSQQEVAGDLVALSYPGLPNAGRGDPSHQRTDLRPSGEHGLDVIRRRP
jgi:hypothetical protein